VNSITARITSSTDVVIRSELEGHTLEQGLIAVNWFDTRIEWLYHLYNYLASRSVLKVGGSPLYKAKVTEVLSDNNGKRSILLVVKYPNGSAFQNLLQSTYFKVVSLLRMRAVKEFTFSFTRAVVNPAFEDQYAHYLIHHFTHKIDLNNVVDFIENNVKEVTILYAGYSFAYLNQKTKSKEEVRVPSIIDNIIILGSESKEVLSSFTASDKFKDLFKKQPLGFLGITQRIF